KLIGGVRESCLRKLGGHDAPDEPDGEAQMLGEDGPDQVAAGDELALRLPERFVFGGPVRYPPRAALVHRGESFPFEREGRRRRTSRRRQVEGRAIMRGRGARSVPPATDRETVEMRRPRGADTRTR